MNSFGIRRKAVLGAATLGLCVLLSASAAHRQQQSSSPPAANELVLAIDPAKSTLHYTVDSTLHTVHGTFAIKSGSLRFDPDSGKASGEIIVDAASGDSGNASRDKKMHKEVLESSRYAEITFRPDRVDGKVQPQTSSTVQVHGTFVLHGAEHELTVPVEAKVEPDHWKGSAKFSVPYIQWGLKNPSNFLLKVNPAVNIDLEMTGSVQLPRSALLSH